MSKSIRKNKIVVITGAGISAESGIPTFRDSHGLWDKHSIRALATPEGWKENPQLVLDFYNQRRKDAANALPNPAHLAVAELEKKYDVVVITQNVDDLHEKAGSTQVIHLHGELNKARSSVDESLVYPLNNNNEIQLGDQCERGSQLRPNVVWFGESVQNYNISAKKIREAGKVLVIGTSLTVYPAAALLVKAGYHTEKVIVTLDIDQKPYGFKLLKGNAVNLVPYVVRRWLDGRRILS